jgi:hypothetical protein
MRQGSNFDLPTQKRHSLGTRRSSLEVRRRSSIEQSVALAASHPYQQAYRRSSLPAIGAPPRIEARERLETRIKGLESTLGGEQAKPRRGSGASRRSSIAPPLTDEQLLQVP